MNRTVKRTVAALGVTAALLLGAVACNDGKACAATPAGYSPVPAPRVYVPPPMPRYVPPPAPRPAAPAAPRPYSPSRNNVAPSQPTIVHHDNGMGWLPFWLIASQDHGGSKC